MLLKDVIAPDGHIFLKSEWAPISNDWPALSFSKRSVGDRLRRDFNPTRDIVLYVGTGNPRSTGDPDHRKRLLSAIQAEPNTVVETRLLVPFEKWEEAQRDYRGRWEYSLAVIRGWNIVGFPLAADRIPQSYRQLGQLQNLGNVVKVNDNERRELLTLELVSVELNLQSAATTFDDNRATMNSAPEIAREIGRMAALLIDRAQRGGMEVTRMTPVRLVESDVHIMLHKKWREQNGQCALCGGKVVIGGDNKLLKASADRIDSQVSRYDTSNVHIAHLGCNLAKNDVSMTEFSEWLAILRMAVPKRQ